MTDDAVDWRPGDAAIRQVLRVLPSPVLAAAITGMIRERGVDGQLARPSWRDPEGRPTLLALAPENFRGDLDVLAGTGAFRVLQMDTRWQARLVDAYYPSGVGTALFHNPPANGTMMARRRAIRDVLARALPALYARLQVDLVLTANNRYRTDHDWGAVSHRIGVPYVVLFREGLLTSPEVYRRVVSRQRNMGRFEGTHIVVHNEYVRRMFVESGYASLRQITVGGCLRMDPYLARLKREPEGRRHGRITFFPFNRDLGRLGDEDIHDTFDGAHVAFVRTARDNPGIEFVIKPKPKDMVSSWARDMRAATRAAGLDVDEIANLRIDSTPDAQDLILQSDVVCGLQSTTLLEAALAGKPVIVPYFRRFRDGANGELFFYRTVAHIFDIAEDTDDFARLLLVRAAQPAVTDAVMAERRRVFTDHISDVNGGTTERYVALLAALAKTNHLNARWGEAA